MLDRVKISRVPVKRTRWPVSLQNDGLNPWPCVQVNALFRWVLIYID